jgi:DNA-binding transcriptional LysR family regulator
MMDWNDLRHFLAVARSGSTLAAARTLRVNQTTCARRIAALEAALGQRLFDRSQDGSVLTESGRALLAPAEAVEAAAQAFADEAAFRARALTGTLRVTTAESIANSVLTPAMGEFARLYPDIAVEMIITDAMMDLAAGEADVAIRATTRPLEGDLVARKVLDCGWALYCSVQYAERHGCPNGLEDLAGHALIGGAGASAGAPWVLWMEANAPAGQILTRSSTLTNQVHAVRSGLGLALLPDLIADADPLLLRCSDYVDELSSVIWMVTPQRLRDVARVRAFMDFVGPYVAAYQQRVRGMRALSR